MVDTITLKFKVSEDGSLTAIEQKADKASKGLKRTGKSARDVDRNLRGVAGMTSNTTKGFSKMQQGLTGGLVPAYAALAANVFAVTAAFGVLSRAAAVKQLNEGLMFTGRAAGQNLAIVTDNLRDITDNAISSADAMRALAVGTSAGFSEAQMEGLTKVARGASLALGRDMTDALDRLTRGAAKLEPEILDELGIIVRLDTVTENYAATLGVAASELTEYERRMAFANAIVEQGEKKFGALSQAVEVNPFNKLAATFDNLTKTIIGGLNTALGPIASFLADNTYALVGALAALGTTVFKQMVPGINSAAAGMRQLAEETADTAKAQLGTTKSFKGAPKVFDSLTKKIREGEASSQDFTKAQNSLTRSIELHQKQMPSYIAAHGAESDAVAIKKTKLKGAQTALAQLTLTQKLETQATLEAGRADIIAAASAGNLKEMLVLLKAQWATEYGLTMLNAKGKGVFAASTIFATFAVKGLAFSLYAVAIGLLAVLPILGALAVAAMGAYTAFKEFFGEAEKVDPLADAMEEGKKRFEEYPNIISQMAEAYKSATTVIDKYVIAITSMNGIMQQTAAQMRKIRIEENAHRIERKLDAQDRIKQGKILMETSLEGPGGLNELGIDKNEAMDLISRGSTRADIRELLRSGEAKGIKGYGPGQNILELQKRLKVFATGYNAASDAITNFNAIPTAPSNKAIALQIATMDQAAHAFIGMAGAVAEAGGEGTEEHTFLLETAKQTQALSERLRQGGDTKKIEEEFGLLQNRVGKTLESFKQLEAAGTDVTEMIAGNTAITGPFAERLKILNKASAALTRTNSSRAQTEAAINALERLGLKFDKDNVESTLEVINTEKNRVAVLNDRLKSDKLIQEFRKKTLKSLSTIGSKSAALELKSIYLKEELTVLNDKINTQSLDQTEIIDALTEKQKKLAQIEQNRLDIIKERLNLTSKVTGGDTTGFGAAMAEIDTVMNAPDFDMEAFKTSGLVNQLHVLSDAFDPVIEGFRKLGPEGEAMAAAMAGLMQVVNTVAMVREELTKTFGMEGVENLKQFSERFKALELDQQLGAVASAVAVIASTFVSLFSTMKAVTENRIKGVDREIAAEKKRDGQSKESQAKITALEAKKEKLKKKAFEQDKKAKMAQVVMATSLAIMQAFAILGPLGFPLAAMFTAMGAAQLAMIAGMEYEGGATGSPSTPSKVSAGSRENTVDLARGNNAGGELAYMRGESGTGRGATDFRPAFMGYTKTRAAGGYIVGEQGPELFMPDVPGEIIPSGQGAGASVNATFNISAIDATGVEDLLNEQKGNIIGMIRDAANDHGEFFLETVDTGAYN